MAELSTVARPYAQALFETARNGGSLDAWVDLLDELAALVVSRPVAQVVADPRLGEQQVLDLLMDLMKGKLPPAGQNFLRLLIGNGRLSALPEVARQFRALKNEMEGAADCLIESAFPMSDEDVRSLLTDLSRKFGLKLKPEVKLVPELIGGARISVGDHVLDSSVRSQLAQMQAALIAA